MAAIAARARASAARPYRLRGMECLCGNVLMAARALTAVYDRFLEPAGLTASQLAVLWCVAAREPLPMREIGEVLVMDKTTVSRNLAGLAAEGLVVSRQAPDARVKLVSCTPKGRRRFRCALPKWRAAQSWVARRVGMEGFEKSVAQSKRLAQAVAARPGAR
jgi:DNA-binding MarR family transcriptional regulator